MFPLFDFLYLGYNAAEKPTGEPLWVMLLSLRLPVLARSAGSPTAILLARQGCGKDLIPTGNALRASAAHSSGRISSKDLIPTGNALRASAAHSSGRISSIAPSSMVQWKVTKIHSKFKEVLTICIKI